MKKTIIGFFKNFRPVDPGPPPKPPDGPPKSKVDSTDFVIVGIGLFFITVFSLYNLSFNGYLGISEKIWKGIWVFAENGLIIYICILISLLTGGVIKSFFRWVLAPYFVLRLIYYLSAYCSFVLLSNENWNYIWSIVMVVSWIVGLVILWVKRYA